MKKLSLHQYSSPPLHSGGIMTPTTSIQPNYKLIKFLAFCYSHQKPTTLYLFYKNEGGAINAHNPNYQ